MKILLPPRLYCKKIYKLLHQFYNNEKENEKSIALKDYIIFKEAIKIFCDWYEIDYPNVNFKRKIDRRNSHGECTEKGTINLLYPNSFHKRNIKICSTYSYVSLVYHELGHYYLWSSAEIKALEFELKMMKRGR